MPSSNTVHLENGKVVDLGQHFKNGRSNSKTGSSIELRALSSTRIQNFVALVEQTEGECLFLDGWSKVVEARKNIHRDGLNYENAGHS